VLQVGRQSGPLGLRMWKAAEVASQQGSASSLGGAGGNREPQQLYDGCPGGRLLNNTAECVQRRVVGVQHFGFRPCSLG
jgi:hypothetical protein